MIKYCPQCADKLRDSKKLAQGVKHCPNCAQSFFIVPCGNRGGNAVSTSWQQIMQELDDLRALHTDDIMRFEIGRYGIFIQWNDLQHSFHSCAPNAADSNTWKAVFEKALQDMREKSLQILQKK